MERLAKAVADDWTDNDMRAIAKEKGISHGS